MVDCNYSYRVIMFERRSPFYLRTPCGFPGRVWDNSFFGPITVYPF